MLNISEYADKGYSDGASYYNYNGVALTDGCTLTLVNTYDAASGTSIISLYKDGALVVENMQNTSGDFGGGSKMDMSPYELDGDLVLTALGCMNSSGSFLLNCEIDYVRITVED